MKPLPVPSDVPTAAVEVLRAWVDGRYAQWAVLPTAFDAPKGWGVLWADAAHQIADVIAAAQLRPLLEQTGVGDYDGDEFGPEEVTLFMYGPDAEALFRVIEPALLAYPLCQNARVIIRPGGPRTRGREIRLPRL
jgi:Domain of unknown function (DUF5076)